MRASRQLREEKESSPVMSRSFAHSPPLAWLLRTLAPPPPTPSLPLALLPLRSDLAFTYSYSLLCNTASSLPLPPRALLRCCSFSIAALTGRVVHRCGVGECDMKVSAAPTRCFGLICSVFMLLRSDPGCVMKFLLRFATLSCLCIVQYCRIGVACPSASALC